ncbi:IclR family transcriptional regulator [Microbacterium indicum]|uniref:IclR family transcriptional regulator n=1 Tax=Microbacterium indicum TaxID=358100 RepID=UPI000418F867|nr:IclR family transcriptional regulator [Microbacterium indicum]
MAAEKGSNQSVEKAVALLEAFRDGQAHRVGEVAKATGIGQSTASRLLATLETAGFIERDPETGLYALGTELLTLAGVAVNRNPVHRAGRMVAQSLAAKLGLGVNLGVRHGAELVYVAHFEGSRSPKSHTLLGERVPLHATSIGKAVLSGLDRADRDTVLARGLPSYTDRTHADRAKLDRELAVVARRGYATEVEEFVLGRASVAAPIVDRTGSTIAAISISGPLTAIDLSTRERELAQTAVETADRISTALGFHGPGY